MVNVRNIAEMGAYVTLLEYNNIEGMILLSELSRRRIRYWPWGSVPLSLLDPRRQRRALGKPPPAS